MAVMRRYGDAKKATVKPDMNEYWTIGSRGWWGIMELKVSLHFRGEALPSYVKSY